MRKLLTYIFLLCSLSAFAQPALQDTTRFLVFDPVKSFVTTGAGIRAHALSNAFTGFTGPTTSIKTFTLPNATATILTDNAAVTVAQGGTGRATSTTAYGLIAAGTTATGAHQTLAAGATTDILVGGGASALPSWTTATGSGSPVRATSPTLVTPALGTPSSGTLTSCTGLPISTGVSGLGTGVATFLATPSTANFAAAVTGETGTGAVVFATSPTLVTPALGTPSSGTLTSCTGLPISTGVSGLGTGVATFLATPSSANAIAAVTDETGTGALVFATSPTLVTPALGTPSAAVLTNATGLPLTTGITGTLAVGNGGTGATTLTGLLQGNGTGAVTAITNSSTVGHVLRATGSNAYAWGALDLADSDAVTGSLPHAYGGTETTTGRATGQTAANTNVVTLTNGGTDASFEVSADVLVTTSSGENFNIKVDYTDEGNTARTFNLNVVGLAGDATANIRFTNGAVPYSTAVQHIRCKASTNIKIYTTGTFTGCTYNVEGRITKI